MENVTTLYVGKIYSFDYTNYEGKEENRRVRFESVSYGRNEYHGDDFQWFLNGHCMSRNARRTFAMKDIVGSSIKDFA